MKIFGIIFHEKPHCKHRCPLLCIKLKLKELRKKLRDVMVTLILIPFYPHDAGQGLRGDQGGPNKFIRRPWAYEKKISHKFHEVVE